MFQRIKQKIRQEVVKIIVDLLEEKYIRLGLWRAANKTPDYLSYAAPPSHLKISDKLFEVASSETAMYILDKMKDTRILGYKKDLLKYSISLSEPDGLFLEFGVEYGDSINLIAETANTTIHGFDSFQGLPENWGALESGTFSTKGNIPKVHKNVILHVGWFNETLPVFIQEFKEPVSFIHIDSDIYSSAKTVLYTLSSQIRKGTIIQFDEYFNYPNWKLHEYKAFQEFVKDFGVCYEYIGYTDNGFAVAVKILEIGKFSG